MKLFLFVFSILFGFFSFADLSRSDNLSFVTHFQNETIHALALEGNYIWCATENGIIRFNKFDGGITRYTTNDGLSSNIICSLAIDKNGVMWFGTVTEGIMSFDGISWKSYFQKFMGGDAVFSIAVDKNNIKYFSFSGGVYRFDGNNWELFNLNSHWRLLLDSDDNLYMMQEAYTLLLYNNSGLRELLPPTHNEFMSIAEDKQKTIWIGCDEGLLSFDGADWTVYDRYKGVNVDYVNSIAVDKYNIKWLGSDSGLWSFDGHVCMNHTDFDGHPVLKDIKIDDNGVIWTGGDGLYSFNPYSSSGVNDSPLPSGFRITAISPNPFNPSTTISFSLPAPATSHLAVYDITGRKVRILASGSLSAGNHSAAWDGRDSAGRIVSSGVYIARLEAGKAARNMKMLLMR